MLGIDHIALMELKLGEMGDELKLVYKVMKTINESFLHNSELLGVAAKKITAVENRINEIEQFLARLPHLDKQHEFYVTTCGDDRCHICSTMKEFVWDEGIRNADEYAKEDAILKNQHKETEE